MKIYQKQKFHRGIILAIAAAIFLSILLIWQEELGAPIFFSLLFLTVLDLIATAACFFTALDKTAAKEVYIEEGDERETLIQLKSGEKAFAILHWILIAVMLGLAIAWMVTDIDLLGVILLPIWGVEITMNVVFTFTKRYYQKHS